MKKLFISCPMNGRTTENIKKTMFKMHQIAEIIFDEKLQPIDSYLNDETIEDKKNESIYCLGRAIEKMADADYFIGVYDRHFRGCNIERLVAQEYDLKVALIDAIDVAPDISDIIKNKYDEIMPKEILR